MFGAFILAIVMGIGSFIIGHITGRNKGQKDIEEKSRKE